MRNAKHCRDCGLEMERTSDLCVGCEADLCNDKLAQLGAHVLEILKDWSISAEGGRRVLHSEQPESHKQFAASAAEWRIILAARELGLLEAKQ